MDLSTYTLPELRRLQAKVESEIRRRSDVTRRNLIKRMQKMAADEGLSLDDLLEVSAPASTEAKPATRRGRGPGANADVGRAGAAGLVGVGPRSRRRQHQRQAGRHRRLQGPPMCLLHETSIQARPFVLAVSCRAT